MRAMAMINPTTKTTTPPIALKITVRAAFLLVATNINNM
jgi:hypothetical protein